MGKTLHKAPMEYRVRYFISGAMTESVQYYSVYHSSEALDFLAHTYRRGHIHSLSENFYINIVAVEEYCRFRDRWTDRTSKAVEFSESAEIVQNADGAVFLKTAKNADL